MKMLFDNVTLSDLKQRITLTGGEHGSYASRHLVIQAGELKELSQSGLDLKKIGKVLKVDFISKQTTGKLNFLHVAGINSVDYIKSVGIKQRNSSWVPNLGWGIYCIEPKNKQACLNLREYISNLYDWTRDEICLVYGTFSGSYIECLYGEYHERFIVLSTHRVSPNNITKMRVMKVGEFLRTNNLEVAFS